MNGSDEIAGLVAAACAGSRDAFEELHRRFARAVHGILIARLPPADAEDAVQEVFLHAWQALGQLRDPRAFAGWLCAIARRRAIDSLRRTRPRRDDPTREPSVEPESHTRVEARLALDAIRALPAAYSETLILRLVEGMSANEISAATGLTPESVRVNLCRGMKLLRERIGARP